MFDWLKNITLHVKNDNKLIIFTGKKFFKCNKEISHNILLRKAKFCYVYKKVNTYILVCSGWHRLWPARVLDPLKKHIHVPIKELSKEHSSKAWFSGFR